MQQTAVTITGTNFKDSSTPPFVDAINSSTGAIVTADSVTFTNATSVTANVYNTSGWHIFFKTRE